MQAVAPGVEAPGADKLQVPDVDVLRRRLLHAGNGRRLVVAASQTPPTHADIAAGLKLPLTHIQQLPGRLPLVLLTRRAGDQWGAARRLQPSHPLPHLRRRCLPRRLLLTARRRLQRVKTALHRNSSPGRFLWTWSRKSFTSAWPTQMSGGTTPTTSCFSSLAAATIGRSGTTTTARGRKPPSSSSFVGSWPAPTCLLGFC